MDVISLNLTTLDASLSNTAARSFLKRLDMDYKSPSQINLHPNHFFRMNVRIILRQKKSLKTEI